MTKFNLILALAALTSTSAALAIDTPVAPQAIVAAKPTVGKMLYSTDGKKLGAVYKIDASGAPQLLLDGRLITIPAGTLSQVDGKTATSLSRKDVLAAR